MALETRLDLRLTQKLVLTPQLQQAIKLLQLPQLELQQALNEELVENPFLEEGVDDDGAPEEASGETDANPAENTETPLEKIFEFGTEDYFADRASDGRDLGYFTPGTEAPPSFEQFLGTTTDLTDHLLWQLRFSDVSPELGAICEAVIGNLNEDGYLDSTAEELGTFCAAELHHVEAAIRIVQSFDPPGIAARDLKECLLIQLTLLELEGSLAARIVQEGLGELERKRYGVLASRFEVSEDDIVTAVRVIEQLEPRPARNFVSGETTYVVPDVTVTRGDDGWIITLNDDGLPRLRLSRFYRKLLGDRKNLSKEERGFLEERKRSALWLLKSIDQRNKTIYRVTESILEFQDDFFDRGVAFLRPMTLKDVARDLGMHESTISRVTSNKYIQTPFGLLPYRFFFSSALQSSRGGAEIAATSVKEMVKKIIAEEDPDSPRSDQNIADILKARGVSIARRTVAKYRDELKIPAQKRRKRASSSTARDK